MLEPLYEIYDLKITGFVKLTKRVSVALTRHRTRFGITEKGFERSVTT